MQKLFKTSLNLSEFEDYAYFECFFISNDICSPYYPIEKKISKVLVAKTNAIINIIILS